MVKEVSLEFSGTVLKLLPRAEFSVQLENKHVITAYIAGNVRRNRIKILVGDKVTVEMSPYDLSRGRISFRHK